MTDEDQIQIRMHGDGLLPTLIYLPGVHGDWTLVSSFRERMKPHVRFVEFTYPRTLSWSLADYGSAALEALAASGIREGVLLGESFGSQVAWEMIRLAGTAAGADRPGSGKGFLARGLILAGGFGRYPFMPLVKLPRRFWELAPAGAVRAGFRAYAIFARWRHRHAPETKEAIRDFLARRTRLDLLAIGHRYQLILYHDPTDVVRETTIPVHQLAGFWDPVVFWPAVHRALRRDCPGFRGRRVIGLADHNVLGTAPDPAAEIVETWIKALHSYSSREGQRTRLPLEQEDLPNVSKSRIAGPSAKKDAL
ncbi:MAG TPA: hypothetical protein DCY13_02525 [Verrucomicrobiales bacterium]|nr:hypothetical protein [Verrucomicrobiales bacterium]